MPRRKPGTLLPLETDVLVAASRLQQAGQDEFHGFGLAQSMREDRGARSLTAHGTLYKALARLEGFGLLRSSWEEQDAGPGRPRRRLYALTGEGARAAERAISDARSAPVPRRRSGPEPA